MILKGEKNCFKVRQKKLKLNDLTDLYWVNMWKGGRLEDTFNISLSVFFFSQKQKKKKGGGGKLTPIKPSAAVQTCPKSQQCP